MGIWVKGENNGEGLRVGKGGRDKGGERRKG